MHRTPRWRLCFKLEVTGAGPVICDVLPRDEKGYHPASVVDHGSAAFVSGVDLPWLRDSGGQEDARGFSSRPDDFDWPYPYVMSFHWGWCIPVGILLATGIIAKDQWCLRRVAGTLNLSVFLAGVGLALLWIWGTVPHRMTQRTRAAWQNKTASGNGATTLQSQVVRLRRAVPENG